MKIKSVTGGIAVQHVGAEIRNFMRRVRIFDPVQNLECQTCAEFFVEDLNGRQMFCQKILCIVVEAGYCNVLRYA